MVVFEDPGEASNYLENSSASTVAAAVFEHVQDNNRWRKIGSLQDPEYGALAVYRNLNVGGDAFDAVVDRHILPVPGLDTVD